MRKLMTLVASATMVLSATALTVVPALADPINSHGKAVTPRESDIVGVGADTDEYLFDQLAVDYNATHPKSAHLYSWDALNPKTGLDENIKTKSGCALIVRPNGASAGLTSFETNARTKDHSHPCIDYVRSSKGRSATDPPKAKGGIVFVAVATDVFTYAANGGKAGTNAPKSLTTARLAAIYNCIDTKWTQVGGKSAATIRPFLPQTGSGLRSSFLKDIGVTAPGTCVNSSVQQNEGTDHQLLNKPNVLVPYSVAKYLSQVFRSNKCTGPKKSGKNQFGCDQHGDLVLDGINGTKPTVGTGAKQTINPKFSPDFINTIYDVVRWASTKDNIPAYLEPLFASSRGKVKGWICTKKTATQAIKNYGFLTTPFCGTGS